MHRKGAEQEQAKKREGEREGMAGGEIKIGRERGTLRENERPKYHLREKGGYRRLRYFFGFDRFLSPYQLFSLYILYLLFITELSPIFFKLGSQERSLNNIFLIGSALFSKGFFSYT